MRKLSFFLAFALVLTLGASTAFSGDGVVTLKSVSNTWPAGNMTDTQLRAGNTHVVEFEFDFSGYGANYLFSVTNQWEIYSPDLGAGTADWGYFQGARGPLFLAKSRKYSPCDGEGNVFPVPSWVGTELCGCGSIESWVKHFHKVGNSGSWDQMAMYGQIEDCLFHTMYDDPYDNVAALGNGGNDTSTVYFSTFSTSAGFMTGEVGVAFTVEFTTDIADDGKTICIDTTTSKQGWNWAAPIFGEESPTYDNGHGGDGEFCWDIHMVPNVPPVWCDPPGIEDSYVFYHCSQGEYDLCATDGGDGGALTYRLVPPYDDGTYGEVNGAKWTWSGSTVPQKGTADIHFQVNDTQDDAVADFVLHVSTTNTPPEITCPPDPKAVSFGGDPGCQDVVASDDDNDGTLGTCDGVPVITVIDKGGATGGHTVTDFTICYTPSAADTALAQPIVWTIQADDGAEQVTCLMSWNVIVGAPYAVEIEKKQDELQGHFTDVAITLYKSLGIGGFDFLVAYDASALAFQLAYGGVVYNLCDEPLPETPDGCEWEYFTYRYGGYGNCGNACPSGMLRVVGMAETNDGPNHPCCDVPASFPPVTLAQLRFLVSNDRTLECQYVPIRFFWYDCGDNVVSNVDGSEAYLSMKVFDFYDYGPDFRFKETDITGDGTQVFPTFQGARDDCEYIDEDKGKIAKRYVDYQNGGVDIACAKDIDDRGDINLNGLAYEIADAVMFTNYFIIGLDAFTSNVEGSIAASDTNADGIALSVADLVYLIRVVIGDAQPYDMAPVGKRAPVAANVTYGDNTFNVDIEMGAVHVVMGGDVTPELLAGNMEMKYGFDGENTNIIIYSHEAGQSFSGDFLRVEGSVVKTEFATFAGAQVVAKVMPRTFALDQNYPNPFNPTATIDFAIPGGGAWSLDIYNITGQLVESYSGVTESGYGSVEWDASDLASGIYFYRLTAGENSMTKKAVLLK